MMAAFLRRCEAVWGLGWTRTAIAAVFIGSAALAAGVLSGHGAVAFGTLSATWLFCAGIASGAVGLSAAVRVVRGQWAAPVFPIAEAAAGFFPSALAVLLIITLGARAWMPAAAAPGAGGIALLSFRQLVGAVILFAVGRRYIARSKAARAGAEEPTGLAVAYLLAYVLVLSLWAVDLILAPAAGAPSTVIPALYFMGAFLSGIAWTALAAASRDMLPGSGVRHDLGTLIFAFAGFWAYLQWSSYLPVWYENIPDETGALLVRWSGAWSILSVAVLGAAFVIPFAVFFPEAGKRGPLALSVGSAITLAGLLGASLLYVLPSLRIGGGAGAVAVGTLVGLGVIGLFFLSVGATLGAVDES
jgi:hypothetical protein